MNRKSHVSGHVIVLRIFGASKSCVFGATSTRCSIDSTPQVEFEEERRSCEKSREVQGFLFD